MAGSVKTMIYTADDDTKWCVQIDESNGEFFGFDDYTGAQGEPKYYLPTYMKMRYVNWRSNDGTVSRRYPVGKKTNQYFTNGGNIEIPVSKGAAAADTEDVAGSITSTRGETRRLPRAADSGITDGDAT